MPVNARLLYARGPTKEGCRTFSGSAAGIPSKQLSRNVVPTFRLYPCESFRIRLNARRLLQDLRDLLHFWRNNLYALARLLRS
jgi:hypothetical protein